jgi:hypothetical protein
VHADGEVQRDHHTESGAQQAASGAVALRRIGAGRGRGATLNGQGQAATMIRVVARATAAKRQPEMAGRRPSPTPRCAAIVDRLTFNGAIIQTGTEPYRLAPTKAPAGQAVAG